MLPDVQPFTLVWMVWAVFAAYWLYAARKVKRPRVRQPGFRRFLAYGAIVIVAVLLSHRPGSGVPVLGLRVWPDGPVAGWAGGALCVAGMTFAIWARRTLADNWSGEVQIKENHALVTNGPYAIVRHPIYAGLCTTLIGTWMTVGSLGGLLGISVGFVGLWRKMKLEERLMREQFPDAYPLYAARVKRLVPGVF